MRTIRCGHCKATHVTVAQVRLCAHRTEEMRAEIEAENRAAQLEAEAQEVDWEYLAEEASERAADRMLEARAERGGWFGYGH